MSKISVNPLVLGVGAIVVASAGSSVLADELDEALTSNALEGSLLTITGAHGEDGECGEKDGDDAEGKCGEGQCGEGECGEGECGEKDDDEGGDDEESSDEEEEA